MTAEKQKSIALCPTLIPEYISDPYAICVPTYALPYREDIATVPPKYTMPLPGSALGHSVRGNN